jgi:hypothetical protein
VAATGWRGGKVGGGSDGSCELPAWRAKRTGGDRAKGEKVSRMERREACAQARPLHIRTAGGAVADMQESEDATRRCAPAVGRP